MNVREVTRLIKVKNMGNAGLAKSSEQISNVVRSSELQF